MKKVKFYLIILVCVFCVPLRSQNVDSLWKVYHNKIQVDTNRLKALDAIINIYRDNNPDTTILLAKQAIGFANTFPNKQGKKWEANIYKNIGVCYATKGNYPTSLNYYLKALKINEEIGNIKGIGACYNNIGEIFRYESKFDKALEYYLKSLNLFKIINFKQGLASAYNNIGHIYEQTNDSSKTLAYYFKSLAIRKEIADKNGIIHIYIDIGNIYADRANASKALEYYFIALNLSKEINEIQGIGNSYINIGEVYLDLSEFKKSIIYLDSSREAFRRVGYIFGERNSYFLLSEAFSKEKHYEEAYNNHLKYTQLSDSLFNTKNNQQLTEMQTQFEVEKKEAEQDKLKAIAKEEKKRQQVVVNAIAVLLLVMIIFSLFMFNRFRVSQKQKKIIEEKNKDITASISYAKRIQQAILPSIDSVQEKLPNSFVLYKPKDIIGGDFYWVSDALTKSNEKFILVAVGDCTGHGVPGALMSIIGNNYLRLCEQEASFNKPSEALDFINAGISHTLRQEHSKNTIQDGMDIAFIAIDYASNKLHFAGAKNPVYIIREGKLIEHKGDRYPIGSFVGEEIKKFTNHTITIQKGDCIYLFSDGYADQFGGSKDKKFTYHKFKTTLISNSHLPMKKQYEVLIDEFNKWKKNTEQTDDICIIGVKI